LIKLTINNSLSKLEGLTERQLKGLRDKMSYSPSPQASYFSGYSAKRYLLDKRGFFPTGLLSIAEAYLKNINENIVRNDLRRRPNALQSSFKRCLLPTPYAEQSEAVAACLGANRGTVSACTGFGKSITIAMLISRLKVKTLVVVPNLSLKKQLQDTLAETLGDISGLVTVENIDSSALKKSSGYDCLIIDEAHHVAAKTYRMLNQRVWGGIYYRFFFTATPFRSNDQEQLLFESVAGEVIYSITYKKAVSKGYVVPVEAYYIDLPKVKLKCDKTSWQAVYNECVVHNTNRNKIIANLLDSLRDADIPALCLVKEVKHGLNICKASEYTHAFAKGENDNNNEMLKELECNHRKTLVGTVGVLGEGVDTKAAQFIIIAALGKSKSAFMQQVGRGVRRYPNKTRCTVILFRDSSHKWPLVHFNKQIKYLKEEYGVTPTQLSL
jgi:superfamily II DNA or RNA helicase